MKQLQMKPEQRSIDVLGITRSQAKMYEYAIPKEHHIAIPRDPGQLLSLTIGILGDYVSLDEEDNTDIERLRELRKVLLFAAQYFDSYVESKLDSNINEYLFVIGSAAYYLASLPGSAQVLISRLNGKCPNLDCDGLENLLFLLLTNQFDSETEITSNRYQEHISSIKIGLNDFYSKGINEENAKENSKELRKLIYQIGNPRELLIGDIINAVLNKRISNSARNCLRKYTNTDINNWALVLQKKSFVKEFWPSQILLGERGVFKGKSAVIQMPTSAGKTKSIEIILRSSFLSSESNLAIIVAPFRALCTEIRNSLIQAFALEKIDVDAPSDTFQYDLESISDIESNKLVLVLTPEKLMYILRHSEDLAAKIGLIIYDEGHQFDSGLRGVTYELLISSLKRLIPKNVQSILISAVISNAEQIGNWLNGLEGEIVNGNSLLPTYRTVGFSSWRDARGMLNFVNQLNPEKNEYYVPRVIEQTKLEKLKNERKEKFFPEKEDGKSISIYLGIKLVSNGSIAIFCGAKSTVLGLCNMVVDLKRRNYITKYPAEFSDKEEISKLAKLHALHFGEDSHITEAAILGVFGHSANTPQGLRLAIEYAMQKNLIRFVICTSTLAQGVNLPIKYLIVTSVYQAGVKISTRDFHNLIGRAGRSGMHTEGSILFADSEVYDNKSSQNTSWKWHQIKSLLNAQNSEPCISTLLSIFDPISSDNGKYQLKIRPLEFVKLYIENKEAVSKLPEQFSSMHSDKSFTKDGLEWQISRKIGIISAIESYLMAYWKESDDKIGNEEIEELAKETLAYFLSDDDKRKEIVELFSILATHVSEKFESGNKRQAYGRTLFGVKDLLEIENWTLLNLKELKKCKTIEKLLEAIWPILVLKTPTKLFKKVTPQESLFTLTNDWIKGIPYFKILENLQKVGAKIIAGTQKRNPQLETVIELCDNTFAFEANLIIGAVRDIINFHDNEEQDKLMKLLNHLQKRIRYGLPSEIAISFYEAGFSDRVLAQELAIKFPKFSDNRKDIVFDIRHNQKEVEKIISTYPAYYHSTFKEVILGY